MSFLKEKSFVQKPQAANMPGADSIDILMATYNGERFLKEQLDSILSQTYPHFRIIVRDDCSRDNTLSLLKEYAEAHPSKITLLRSDAQLGVKANFSELMRHATAPYIMFCDQDDIWLPSKVEETLQAMKTLEERYGENSPLLVHSDLKVMSEDGSVRCDSFWNYANLDAEKMKTLNRLLTQNVVTGCSMMLNRALCSQAYPIPEKCCMHDWWIALVASLLGKVETIKTSTILYRQHQSNVLGAKKFGSMRHLKEKLTCLSKDDDTKREQAQTLLKRYGDSIDKDKKELLEVYLTLSRSNWLKSRYFIIKHQFLKSGFRRNLFAFFFKKQP